MGNSEFCEMTKELEDMLADYRSFFRFHSGRDITPEDIEGLEIRPPMNPVEEAVGMMIRTYNWLGQSKSDDKYTAIGRNSHKYAIRLDEINDKLWMLIDDYEKGRMKR